MLLIGLTIAPIIFLNTQGYSTTLPRQQSLINIAQSLATLPTGRRTRHPNPQPRRCFFPTRHPVGLSSRLSVRLHVRLPTRLPSCQPHHLPWHRSPRRGFCSVHASDQGADNPDDPGDPDDPESGLPPLESDKNKAMQIEPVKQYLFEVPSTEALGSRDSAKSLLRLLEIYSKKLLEDSLSHAQPHSSYRFNILEIASNMGATTMLSHPLKASVHRHYPQAQVVWVPSERSQARIKRFTDGARNRGLVVGKREVIRSPIEVDTAKSRGRWIRRALGRINAAKSREEMYSLVVTSNLLHQNSFNTFEGLLAGAVELLREGGLLAIHGCFTIDGVRKKWRPKDFKSWLYSENPSWGVHDLRDVLSAAEDYGFTHLETIVIPTPSAYIPSIIHTDVHGMELFSLFPADDFVMILSNDHGKKAHEKLPMMLHKLPRTHTRTRTPTHTHTPTSTRPPR
ncbi:hypothetical protein AAMO2058_001270500 [Amorphochlora amoebiformis]|uniref:Methyltransferase type 11 domain-containing protein n=1 Tax=Amorphochlora amoebiformis TaxID=1561963 RepID=A0A7S0GX82_9EUKA|mmetsp:Transcript_2440/g.3520  ORF Transcript_2440/g.3520 Transcript_2440/m.3520 type:complete len:453 (+) Transcript_2440:109-1467(+)